MVSKNSDSVQALQLILGRTHKGRVIRKRAMPAVRAWRRNDSSEYARVECQTCGLVLKQRFFINGCLNCGSTDTEQVED